MDLGFSASVQLIIVISLPRSYVFKQIQFFGHYDGGESLMDTLMDMQDLKRRFLNFRDTDCLGTVGTQKHVLSIVSQEAAEIDFPNTTTSAL